MQQSRLFCLVFVSALFLYGPLAAGQDGAQRASAAGQLVKEQGLPVLRLFAPDIKERGFAHGWYLGKEVIETLNDAMISLPLFTKEKYEHRLLKWSQEKFTWDAEAIRELDGLFEGMQARLGAKGLFCKTLERALTRNDLYAINCIADWYGPACSGFTAWRTRTVDGSVMHGRNLDFPIGTKAMGNQVIFAAAPLLKNETQKARKAWVGVGWPGLTGIYSAMNADGLVCCLHDANNVLKGGKKSGFVNRGILLRRILETVDAAAGDPAGAAAKIASLQPTACGNLFHLSWPSAIAKKDNQLPGAVLEFDAQGREPGGTAVHIRRMTGADFLVLTNHYCKRAHPDDTCERFKRITNGMEKLTAKGGKIDYPKARKILIGGEHSVPTAAHTLVFFPDERSLYVSITRGNILSTRAVGKKFLFKNLIKRTESKKELVSGAAP